MRGERQRYFETYLGDGVYAYISPAKDAVLYTSNGVEEKNHIVLEDQVLKAFGEWMKAVSEHVGKIP